MLTITDALDDLRAIVAEKGAGTTASGRYFEVDWTSDDEDIIPDSPCCLVGHVFAREGIEVPIDSNWSRMRTLWDRDHLKDKVSLGALMVLSTAQDRQDAGATWGEALEAAEKTAERFVNIIPDSVLARVRVESQKDSEGHE